MEIFKKFIDLKKNDRFKTRKNEVLQVISFIKNDLFIYNETTREFKTLKILNKNNYTKILKGE